jgi:hypothetical protein
MYVHFILVTESEAKVRLAVWYVKDLLDRAREYWIECEDVALSVEEQAAFWTYFDSKERTFLLNRQTGTTKKAKAEL